MLTRETHSESREIYESMYKDTRYWCQKCKIDVENLISQLLEAEKRRWREEVEGLRKKKNSIKHFSGNGYFNQQGYNQALDAVLQKLS